MFLLGNWITCARRHYVRPACHLKPDTQFHAEKSQGAHMHHMPQRALRVRWAVLFSRLAFRLFKNTHGGPSLFVCARSQAPSGWFRHISISETWRNEPLWANRTRSSESVTRQGNSGELSLVTRKYNSWYKTLIWLLCKLIFLTRNCVFGFDKISITQFPINWR